MDSITPYATLEEAQSYFDDCRLNAESWDNSTPENQLKALKSATISIDRLNFKGSKVDPTQANEFPRITGRLPSDSTRVIPSTGIPRDIQVACCELALSLLDGVDPDLEEEDLSSITEAYATVRVTSDPNVRKDHIRAGIISVVAWKYLLPYLNDPFAIYLRRG